MSILSIQSHVVYGYAGNTAATFPLQRLGFEVWAVNTVEFSNHTGYKSWRGKVLGAELAEELVLGVFERGGLSRCDAVLSGYLGDPSVAHAVINAVRKVKSINSHALYCCDPVMGDVGRGFYVHPEIPDMFRDKLITLADILTPNQFELEALSGIQIKNINDACKAIKMIHDKGVKIVLLTSFREAKQSNRIGLLASLASDGNEIYYINTPELPISIGMAGSGDITTSLFLARYLETKDIKKTLELCTSSIFSIIEKSWQFHNANAWNPALMELRLIHEQKEIVSPNRVFTAVAVSC